MNERKRFEAWWASKARGASDSLDAKLAWYGWQAGRKVKVPEDVREAAKRFNSPGHYRHEDAIRLADFAIENISGLKEGGE